MDVLVHERPGVNFFIRCKELIFLLPSTLITPFFRATGCGLTVENNESVHSNKLVSGDIVYLFVLSLSSRSF